MAIAQKVKFGGTTLATGFYDTEERAPDVDILRRKSAGVVGEFELRLGVGGSDTYVPIHLFAKNKKDLNAAIRDVYDQLGKHDSLVLVYNSSAQRSASEQKVGKVTFQNAAVAQKSHYVAFMTELNGPGWRCVLVLSFRKLHPDD